MTEQPREKYSVTSMLVVRARPLDADELWSAHGNSSIVVWDPIVCMTRYVYSPPRN